MAHKYHHLLTLSVLGIVIAGCSGRPSALRPPDLDPEAAAVEAMELYDNDGDGLLSLAELEACPGILVSMEIYDQNSDKMVSPEEIVQRLRRYVDRGIALARMSASVRLDRRPLGGATIRFVPEAHLDDQIRTATGQTRPGGSATMAVADEELPENQKGILGVHNGTYRVEITHPEVDIPAKYNTESTLGFEPKPGTPYAKFDLKSR